MIAKLENLGPFHFFFTLSCGDTRYSENFSTFLSQNNYTMNYIFNQDNHGIEIFVESLQGRKIRKTLETFLQEDVSESLHEMIRSNVLTATRTFQHRVESFRNEVMMGRNSPMKIKYISYRVEFQGRGAAHIHGILWLDMGLEVGIFLRPLENSEMMRSSQILKKILFPNSQTCSSPAL